VDLVVSGRGCVKIKIMKDTAKATAKGGSASQSVPERNLTLAVVESPSSRCAQPTIAIIGQWLFLRDRGCGSLGRHSARTVRHDPILTHGKPDAMSQTGPPLRMVRSPPRVCDQEGYSHERVRLQTGRSARRGTTSSNGDRNGNRTGLLARQPRHVAVH
jgi:hypothetical protein